MKKETSHCYINVSSTYFNYPTCFKGALGFRGASGPSGHSLLATLLAIMPLAGMTTAAYAQATPSASAEPVELETITIRAKKEGMLDTAQPPATSSRLNLSIRETPASIEVINQETLQKRGARTFEEALRGATGVMAANSPTSPGISATRGFAGGAMSYLYDGARISVPTMSSRLQDTFNYERIEVLKGPASVLYGEGAIGGVVNFVPKRPDRDNPGGEIMAAYGSFDSVRVGAGLGGKVGEKGAYRFDYSHNRTNGYIDRTRMRLDNLTTALTFDLTPALKLDLSLDHMQDAGQVSYGVFLIPANLAAEPTSVVSDAAGRVVDKRFIHKNYNLTDSEVSAKSWWGRAALSWKFAEQWTLKNQLSFYTADRKWLNAESLRFEAPDRLVYDQVGVTHDHQVAGNLLAVSYDGKWRGKRNRFTGGFEYSKTNFATERRFSNGTPSTEAALQQNMFNPGAVRFINDLSLYTGAGNRTNFSTDVATTSLFVEDAITFADRWTLVGGLRTDGINLDRYSHDLDNGAESAYSKNYRANSYRAGLVYDVTDQTTLYGQYTNAVAPVGTSNMLLLSAANAAFPLTRGKQFEIGLKQSVTPRFDWTLALYDIQQSNVLSRDQANPAVTVNNGQISSRGVELSAQWKVTRRTTLGGNVAVLNAEFDTLHEAGGVSRVGNTPPNVPERTANLWLDYRFAQLPLSAGLAFNHVGAIYTNNANTTKINNHTTADAYVNYTVKPGTTLAFRVRNISDKVYATWTGANANNQVLIGAPRSADLTLNMAF